MSKIISVVPKNGYVLTISFSDGSTLNFSMKRQVNTVQFRSIREEAVFQKVSFDDKSVFWRENASQLLRLTVDSILFTLRDAP